jgi:hypothetical protein
MVFEWLVIQQISDFSANSSRQCAIPEQNVTIVSPVSVNVTQGSPDAQEFLKYPIQLSRLCANESWFTPSAPDDIATTVSLQTAPTSFLQGTSSTDLTTTTTSTSTSTLSVSTSTSLSPSMQPTTSSSQAMINAGSASTANVNSKTTAALATVIDVNPSFLTLIPISWADNPVTTLTTVVSVGART